MTEDNKPGNLENLLRYQYGDIAGHFLENPEDPHMSGSLENMAKAQGIKESEYSSWYKGTMASAEGMKVTAKDFADKYKEAYSKATIGELFSYYSAGDFKLSQNFKEGQIAIISAKLSAVKNMTLKELQENLKAYSEMAKKISKGEEKASEEEILRVTSMKTMYEQALQTVAELESMKTKSLMAASYPAGVKLDLKKQGEGLMKYLGG